MNEQIIIDITNNLNIKRFQTENTLKLLEEGNTIPFIARYRKEATNGLNETQIKEISDVYKYQINLLKRKEDVIRLIDEKNLLTEDLKNKIMTCTKLVDIEDLYRPYKEKKKTKATDAINNGLEPLAKIIMSFPNKSLEEIINNYTSCKVTTYNEKYEGVMYIIAEWISDNASYRKHIRNYIFNNGLITSKLKKNAKDENKTYEMYYDYNERIKYIKDHRVLALNRGENEDVLNVKITIDDDKIISYLENKIIKYDYPCSKLVKDAIKDSYKRLIFPSVEREIRSDLTTLANKTAIDNFSSNVSNLLLTPPMKEIRVLGFDPAFRTGCKLAVLEKNGSVLWIDKIYPHEPHNKVKESEAKIVELVNKYNIDVIAIGNGTASRESERFIANTIKNNSLNCKYVIVSEAGASVYSASDLAIKEFPNLDVAERSAISIGRRLQDPLSELVKIDPKSIGVGLYQHDLKQKELDEALDFAVGSVVNSVGVNINTASPSLLKYISGLNSKTIASIIKEKERINKFTSRMELKKILSDKVFEQSIGFIRINDASNVLDRTKIHPESYEKTYSLLKYLNLSLEDIGTPKIKEVLNNVVISNIEDELKIDKWTLEDIISCLKEPLRDPREDYSAPVLKEDILTIDDLKVGMKLQGVVRNVVDFGAFIDIGLHNDGLVHISQITTKYIKHPSEVLTVGDIVDCYVKEIYKDKEKVSLTLIEM